MVRPSRATCRGPRTPNSITTQVSSPLPANTNCDHSNGTATAMEALRDEQSPKEALSQVSHCDERLTASAGACRKFHPRATPIPKPTRECKVYRRVVLDTSRTLPRARWWVGRSPWPRPPHWPPTPSKWPPEPATVARNAGKFDRCDTFPGRSPNAPGASGRQSDLTRAKQDRGTKIAGPILVYMAAGALAQGFEDADILVTAAIRLNAYSTRPAPRRSSTPSDRLSSISDVFRSALIVIKGRFVSSSSPDTSTAPRPSLRKRSLDAALVIPRGIAQVEFQPGPRHSRMMSVFR